MIYHFWASKRKYNALKKSGYKELPCLSDDREVFMVDTEKKVFEVTFKHIEVQAPYSEDINFILTSDEEIYNL